MFTCGDLHPDGVLLGAGLQSGGVKVWDIRAISAVDLCHTGRADGSAHPPVNALRFSESGYHMGVGYIDGTMEVWDLRKNKSLHAASGVPAKCFQFDPSGQYIAYGAENGYQVQHVKEWTSLVTLDSTTTPAAVAWGKDCGYITGATERSVNVFR
jgi:WD40 repeat protein